MPEACCVCINKKLARISIVHYLSFLSIIQLDFNANMEPLHFNAKTMTEKRARIAAQEAVIAKAQAILDEAVHAKMSDQIVDRIFGLMNGVVAYKKSRRYVRVMLNLGLDMTPAFIQSIVDKIVKAGFQCFSTSMGCVQKYSAPHRHVWSMTYDHHISFYKDVALYSKYHTEDDSEAAKEFTVIEIPNTWIPESANVVSCEDNSDSDSDSVISVEELLSH